VRHELLYICTKGSCPLDVRKLYKSVQCSARTEHSRKPERFREIIDTIYPYGSRIELFQRGDSVPSHWRTWGAEAAQMAEAA
jgi:N6-adenosine-specific RNA methylase IME4